MIALSPESSEALGGLKACEMRMTIRLALAVGTGVLLCPSAEAQLGMFTKEQRAQITSEWKGERAPDGRPLVPESILTRMGSVTAEEAWGTLQHAGYKRQFESGWKVVHTAEPGKRLVGRVVTAVFMPLRPDLNNYINQQGAAEGRIGKNQNSWVIDTLKPNDVLVVDLFGKVDEGTFAGDRLGTSIFAKSKTGLVVNGAVRDVSGISEIKGFIGYVRDFHPSALEGTTMVGINVPIRIGEVTVLPGDVLLSDPEGLTFIPAHLAEKVVTESEDTRARDEWGHLMLREGKYTPGQIDSKWTEAMEAEFSAWAAKQKK